MGIDYRVFNNDLRSDTNIMTYYPIIRDAANYFIERGEKVQKKMDDFQSSVNTYDYSDPKAQQVVQSKVNDILIKNGVASKDKEGNITFKNPGTNVRNYLSAIQEAKSSVAPILNLEAYRKQKIKEYSELKEKYQNDFIADNDPTQSSILDEKGNLRGKQDFDFNAGNLANTRKEMEQAGRTLSLNRKEEGYKQIYDSNGKPMLGHYERVISEGYTPEELTKEQWHKDGKNFITKGVNAIGDNANIYISAAQKEIKRIAPQINNRVAEIDAQLVDLAQEDPNNRSGFSSKLVTEKQQLLQQLDPDYVAGKRMQEDTYNMMLPYVTSRKSSEAITNQDEINAAELARKRRLLNEQNQQNRPRFNDVDVIETTDVPVGTTRDFNKLVKQSYSADKVEAAKANRELTDAGYYESVKQHMTKTFPALIESTFKNTITDNKGNKSIYLGSKVVPISTVEKALEKAKDSKDVNTYLSNYLGIDKRYTGALEGIVNSYNNQYGEASDKVAANLQKNKELSKSTTEYKMFTTTDSERNKEAVKYAVNDLNIFGQAVPFDEDMNLDVENKELTTKSGINTNEKGATKILNKLGTSFSADNASMRIGQIKGNFALELTNNTTGTTAYVHIPHNKLDIIKELSRRMGVPQLYQDIVYKRDYTYDNSSLNNARADFKKNTNYEKVVLPDGRTSYEIKKPETLVGNVDELTQTTAFPILDVNDQAQGYMRRLSPGNPLYNEILAGIGSTGKKKVKKNAPLYVILDNNGKFVQDSYTFMGDNAASVLRNYVNAISAEYDPKTGEMVKDSPLNESDKKWEINKQAKELTKKQQMSFDPENIILSR